MEFALAFDFRLGLDLLVDGFYFSSFH